MEYLLGIDIGTTAVKVLLVDSKGHVMVKSNVTYGLILPHPNWVEQDPEAMWQAVLRAMEEALSKFTGERRNIRAISLSTQRDTLICVDNQNRPVRNAITWMDSRSTAQCDRLECEFGAQRVYEITGVGVSTIWTLAFILWLRDNEPEVFKRTCCFGLVHDFILCRLGVQEHILDSSNACQTMLYDLAKDRWNDELMAYAGLSEDRLPRLVKPGTAVGYLCEDLSKRFSLPQDVILVSGGGDQQCAALGAGAVHAGDVELGMGTAANILAICPKPLLDPQRRMICHRSAVPGRWVLEGAMLATGKLLEWLQAEIYSGQPFSFIDGEIESHSPAGAGGLILLPHFEGAACPHWNPRASGVFFGLSLSSTRADIARAVLEGICFEIRKNFDLLYQWNLSPSCVLVSGGAAKSSVWMQLLSDILGRTIAIPAEPDCAALGAAILAGVGSGIFPDAADAAGQITAIAHTYMPRTECKELYEGLYQKNRVLYQSIQSGGLYG